MKKLLTVMLACLFVVILAACSSDSAEDTETNSSTAGDSGSSSTTETNNTDSSEQVELTFSIWGSDAHVAMYEDLLEEFYKENSNITVKLDVIPFADYQQKMSVLAAGNELPDVGWVSEAMVPQFKKNGILSDVSELKTDTDFDFGDFIPKTTQLWEDGEQLLGIPFSTPPMILYYNKTMFTDAGVETPYELAKKGEWTWEKLEEVSKQITSGEGTSKKYGVSFFREWTNFSTLPSHTISYGGKMFNDDMTEFTWNSEQGINTFSYLQKLMFEDKIHVPPGEMITFESGQIGIYTAMYSYMGTAREIKDFEWDVAPLPAGPNGSAPLLGQAGISVFKGGEHEAEAKKLLAFLGSKTGIKGQSAFFVPARASVLGSDEFLSIPNNPPIESLKLAMLDTMNDGYTYPQHENWTKIESEILNGLDQLFGQSASPAEILQSMEDNIQPLL